MARGKHLFPFRTEPLSPSAPMVLGPQGPGRVGRRRFFCRFSPVWVVCPGGAFCCCASVFGLFGAVWGGTLAIRAIEFRDGVLGAGGLARIALVSPHTAPWLRRAGPSVCLA